jgi:hypothetical protein
LRSWVANTNRVRLARNTFVADIDIVIASGETHAGINAEGDVVVAGCVVSERGSTDGRVLATV